MKPIHASRFILFLFIIVLLDRIATVETIGIEPSPVNPSSENSSFLSAYRIEGNVVDMTIGVSEMAMDRFESALRKEIEHSTKMNGSPSDVGINELFERFLMPKAASNAVVILVGESVRQETIADSEGNFCFVGFPKGVYKLTAESPARNVSGRKATGHLRCDFSPGRIGNWARIEIHAYPVTIEGRVTTADGHPVAGAKVTGGPVCLSDDRKNSDPEWLKDGLERMREYEISAETTSNGTYRIEGYIPPGIYEIAGYLGNGSDGLFDTGVPDSAFSRFYADVRVEAAGYTQRTVPRVPLVTENLLGPARHFMHLMFKISDYPADREKLKGFQEKGAVLPSQGDTIPNIDIVLDPVIAAESASQENPPPPHPSDTHK